jgi:hypothetical protein
VATIGRHHSHDIAAFTPSSAEKLNSLSTVLYQIQIFSTIHSMVSAVSLIDYLVWAASVSMFTEADAHR